MGNEEEKEEFRFEFIKYHRDIAKENKLSDGQALIYGYIREVISYSSKIPKHKWRGVCFASSIDIWKNVWKKPWTVDNSIKVLKDRGLIEIINRYNKKYNRNSRYIYMPWESPINWDDKVELFFNDMFTYLEDNKRTRAIIWDLLYKKECNSL